MSMTPIIMQKLYRMIAHSSRVRIAVCHLSMASGGDADDQDIRIPSKIQYTKVMDRFEQRKDTSSNNAADTAPFEEQSEPMRTKLSREPEPLPARLDEGNAVMRKTADQSRFNGDRTPNLTASRTAKFNAMVRIGWLPTILGGMLTTSIADQITVAPRQPSPYAATEMEIGVS